MRIIGIIEGEHEVRPYTSHIIIANRRYCGRIIRPPSGIIEMQCTQRLCAASHERQQAQHQCFVLCIKAERERSGIALARPDALRG